MSPDQAVQAVQGSNLDATAVCCVDTTGELRALHRRNTHIDPKENRPAPPAQPDQGDESSNPERLTVTQGGSAEH
ncbi:hypothetical protein [Adonisia turfae]|uniref:hypothetical protein n=1 Tax=Adonisia turfae TaxID=2950184 RepID=UPI0013D8B988|nr:hypothetical protein [Adonisia turfae]